MKIFLSTLMLMATANATYAQESQQVNSPPPPEPPRVRILPQPASPLRISSVKTKWAVPDRSGIELYLVVENVGGKNISAYATRDDSAGEGGRDCLLRSANSPGKVLRPGQSQGTSTWRGYAPQSKLQRLVDFVEYADGTAWGDDLCRSAELLAGARAGAREARKQLLGIFAAGGADAVIGALKAGLPEVEPPPDHTPRWAQSYRSGFRSYAERIMREEQEWGYTEIEHALSRPIDALEEKEP